MNAEQRGTDNENEADEQISLLQAVNEMNQKNVS